MPRTKEQFEEIRVKTKSEILKAGLKLFARKGYRGTSISDIAREAGISKGLAYNYFESKENLLEEILRLMAESFNFYNEIFRAELPPCEKLKLLIDKTIEELRNNKEMWLLYIGMLVQRDTAILTKKVLKELFEEYVEELVNIFDSIGLKNGRTEALIFGATIDGISIDYLYGDLYGQGNYPLEKVGELLINKYCGKH